MPIYHLSTKPISRSKGQSAIACAAYRAADKLMDEKYGVLHDYTRKGGVAYSEILMPENTPEWMSNREKLWNHVETIEMRKDSRLARELEISLPRELSLEQNVSLIKEFVQQQFVSKGIIADFSVHVEKASDGETQPHVHVMLTTREILNGEFGKKITLLDKKESLLEWRKEWADCANKHLAINGHDLRIDHRSLQDQGIDLEPQKKIGVSSSFYRNDSRLEHDDIARRNGEKLLEKPDIVFTVLTNQQSTFTHQDIARIVNRYTVDADQFQLVYEKVKSSPELVYLGADDKNRERFTTRAMLQLESEMVGDAKSLATREGHAVEGNDSVITGHSLSLEQKHVLEHLVSAGDLKSVVGFAGSGKSRLLGAAKELWEGSGYRVLGAALSGIAAENLQASSGIDSRTIASRFHYWDRGEELLSSRDVLVIDEAGMIDSRQMHKLLSESNAQGAKVVLVGDPEQLQAIQAGAAFRAIAERTSYVELTEIWRQKVDWQKEATVQFATQQTEKAFAQYAAHECVHEYATSQQAKGLLVDAWNDARISEPNKTQLMLAYTRADVSDLNQMARAVRQSLGEIGDDQLILTERGERQFAEGDRIYFLKNDRELGVKNGTLGTIAEINENAIKVSLDREGEEKIISFSTERYNDLDYGYAATIHKSQGTTVDHSFVLASRYLDRHAMYVAMTRHRDGVEVYYSKEEFPTYDAMVDTLSRERNKEFSLDYPERDFAAYRDIASEGWSTFESYPVELGQKDDVVLDWKSLRSDVDQHDAGFTQELREHLFASTELGHVEKGDLPDPSSDHVADWRTELFQGLEHPEKEQDDFKDLFVGLEVEPDDTCLSQDRQMDDGKEMEF